VAAVKNFLPVRIARQLMEKGPHALLVGAGAECFARDCGLLPEPTLSPAQYEKWERQIKPMLENQGGADPADSAAAGRHIRYSGYGGIGRSGSILRQQHVRVAVETSGPIGRCSHS
jgi:isoaspartyl peptidase/L-asparaginase-like protein (Ntn-hydrolase superfamily)